MRSTSSAILILLAACTARRQADACSHAGSAFVPLAPGPRHVQTVFVVVMENADWSQIRGSKSAPFLNGLLAEGAHAEQYYNPPRVHPSKPNYLWMEGGTDFAARDDEPPTVTRLPQRDHLVTLLQRAGVSWKAYAEGISPGECPIRPHGYYEPRHVPFVYFDDVTSDAAFCAAHVRPLPELAEDLKSGTIARYNFVTPDLCSDMHGAAGCPPDGIRAGDDFLRAWIPRIQASSAWPASAIFVTWDEGEGSKSDGPIGMVLVSPFAKKGAAVTTRLTHSSLLRSLQEIFGAGPLLCDAAAAPSLRELFSAYP